jgi:hypothetical protein
MSVALDRNEPRPLGIRVSPILRLKIGYRDEAKKGAPTKVDHFIPVSDNETVVSKFKGVYGPEPKAVDVMLMPELRQTLRIEYRAWGSGGDEEGGVLKAYGEKNFALEGFAGGPDLLTVFNPDGTVSKVEIAGLDDPVARELGLDMYTTFRAGLPKVLGMGDFFEITSKGKRTTDTLWVKLNDLYAIFGMRVTYAVVPKLVVRPAKARPVVVDKKTGETKRISTRIYALDLIVPESIEESLERLRERGALLGGQTPAAALYGGQIAELPPAVGAGVDEGDARTSPSQTGTDLPTAEVSPAAAGATGEAEAQTVAAAASPSPPSPDAGEFPDEPGAPLPGFNPPSTVEQTPEVVAANEAAEFVVDIGRTHRGKKIGEVDEGWLDYMLTRLDPAEPKTAALCEAIRAFTRIYQPELYQKAMTAKGVAV